MSHVAPASSMRTLTIEELRAWAAIDQAPAELSDALSATLSRGGKGLRPAIVFEVARQGPHPDAAAVTQAAKAVEILHTATMVHDDVLDRGELRRGDPTLFRLYGSHTAATVGVWLLGRSVWLLTECGQEALAHASGAIEHMFSGQLLEVMDLFDVDRGAARYFEIIAGKTAALFGLSAWLGGRLAGQPASRAATLERFGFDLGVAYQIADDILDLCGTDDAGTAGSGGDIRNGVFTLPVIYALETEPRLRDPLTRPFTDETLSEIVQTIKEGDGISRALCDCRAHLEAASRAAQELADDRALQRLVDYVGDRCEGVLA